jgi:hypothetical protein
MDIFKLCPVLDVGSFSGQHLILADRYKAADFITSHKFNFLLSDFN